MKVAVGFDFDRTLGVDNHLERWAFGRLATELGSSIDFDKPGTSELIEDLLTPFRAAEETMSEMLARFALTLPRNGKALPSADELSERYRHICYDMIDDFVQPVPGAIECIADLVEQGTPVGILTNGWSQLQERKIKRALGEFPGPILVSATLRAYKPSAAAFRELEKALGVSPDHLWYVGDNPVTDIAGARAYGLRAVWLKTNGTPFPAGLTPPTVAIEHLSELAAIVRGA